MSQFALKLIALFAMLADHTVKTVLGYGSLAPAVGMETERVIRVTMLVIGRMAFPIFAWFSAEACRKTASPARHLTRLGLFALLSEAPFQLLFHGELTLGATNVIVTMFLAALAIHAAPWLEGRGISTLPARLFPAAAAVALGWFLHTDYNAWGVGLVIMLYYLPDQKRRLLFLTAWVTVFHLFWHGVQDGQILWLQPRGWLILLYYLGYLLAVALLACYNGKLGPKSKWLFYVFYPVHLSLLYLMGQQ